jgi:hypothetical protein
MNAEQYRALVAKLEAINPSEPVLEAPLPYGTTAPVEAPAAADATATNSGSSYTGAVGTATNDPAPAPAPAADPNQIPTIEAATFSQAYAQAVKQGLKKFKWCGTYAVKAKPQPVRPQPVTAKPQGKVDYLGQQDPLGGDAQNPMSFAANSNFGA